MQSWLLGQPAMPCVGFPSCVPSSAALRVARGAGEERPEPGGENSCRLAVGSAAMLDLAVSPMSVQCAIGTGHVVAIWCAIARCLVSQHQQRRKPTRGIIGEYETKAPTFVIHMSMDAEGANRDSNISS